MRSAPCLLLALTACVHAGAQFYPVRPDEVVAGQPQAATAADAGVRLTVHAGDWRGSPDDLEDRLTPVEAYVENDGGRAIRIGTEHFGLLGPNGFRYQALDAQAVQAAFASASRGSVVYVGAYGAYPWPGFWRPYRHNFYPYMGWGWYGPPPDAWVTMPSAPPPPTPRGTLDSGGNVSLLLFFPVPARRLGAMEISMTVEDTSGARLGVVRVGLSRQPLPASATAPPPGAPAPQAGAAAQPPAPPPSGAPPPPPPVPRPPPAETR